MGRVLALFSWGLGRMGLTEPSSPGLLQVTVSGSGVAPASGLPSHP